MSMEHLNDMPEYIPSYNWNMTDDYYKSVIGKLLRERASGIVSDEFPQPPTVKQVMAADIYATSHNLSVTDALRIMSVCGKIADDGVSIEVLIDHIKAFAPGL